jgi:hypothetical protein
MSALGQKQTLAQVSVMSALPPKADIGRLRMASTFIWKTQPPSRAQTAFSPALLKAGVGGVSR